MQRSIIFSLLAGTSLMSAPAIAQSVLPAEAASDDASEIIVIGRGETRQVQEIGQVDIAPLAPGTTALKALEKLPSVNFQCRCLWRL